MYRRLINRFQAHFSKHFTNLGEMCVIGCIFAQKFVNELFSIAFSELFALSRMSRAKLA